MIEKHLKPDLLSFESQNTLDEFLHNVFSPNALEKFVEFISSIIRDIHELDKSCVKIFYEDNVFILFLHGYQLVKLQNNILTTITDLHAFSFDMSQLIIESLKADQKNKYSNISDNVVELEVDASIFDSQELEDFKDSVSYLITELFIKPIEIEVNADNKLISYFNSDIEISDIEDEEIVTTKPTLSSADTEMVKNLIELDEQYNVEFKAAFFDSKYKVVFNKKIKKLEEVENEQKNQHTNTVLETVNAFLNYTNPCYLLIGVADCGCCIGIENDYKKAKRNIKDLRSYEETFFNIISETMGTVAASNIKLDFINVTPDDMSSINYPNECNLEKSNYFKFYKHLHREDATLDATIGMITTYPSKTPVFFSPLPQDLEKKYMAKKLYFTRGGSSDRNNDFEETLQQIKNRYPDYL